MANKTAIPCCSCSQLTKGPNSIVVHRKSPFPALDSTSMPDDGPSSGGGEGGGGLTPADGLIWHTIAARYCSSHADWMLIGWWPDLGPGDPDLALSKTKMNDSLTILKMLRMTDFDPTAVSHIFMHCSEVSIVDT